jgi:hypothetical protein
LILGLFRFARDGLFRAAFSVFELRKTAGVFLA